MRGKVTRLSISLRAEIAATLRRKARMSGKPVSHVIEDVLKAEFATCHKA
jgi:hypothetical protein